jgi:hypothetical protein
MHCRHDGNWRDQRWEAASRQENYGVKKMRLGCHGSRLTKWRTIASLAQPIMARFASRSRTRLRQKIRVKIGQNSRESGAIRPHLWNKITQNDPPNDLCKSLISNSVRQLPEAPPDNVLVVPLWSWRDLFLEQLVRQPDSVHFEVHVRTAYLRRGS